MEGLARGFVACLLLSAVVFMANPAKSAKADIPDTVTPHLQVDPQPEFPDRRAAIEAQKQEAARLEAERLAREAEALRQWQEALKQTYYGNGYQYGQCTYYVANRRNVPGFWGNAGQWLWRAQSEGWAVGSAPAIGAIAWTPAGWVGHVAIVEQVMGNQVYISEMNYIGWNTVSSRIAWASEFSYIY